MKAKTEIKSSFAAGNAKYMIPALLIVTLPVLFTSCNKDLFCNGQGTLTVQNSSLHTVQRILISNTDYGTLDPGETKDIKLPKGTYKLKFVGISGGSGCGSESEVIVPGCDNIGRQCSY